MRRLRGNMPIITLLQTIEQTPVVPHSSGTSEKGVVSSYRVNGNLSREKFVFASIMSRFHLPVQFDLSIVKALRAEAASPEQRFFKVTQHVGLPMHGLSKSYFDIADSISRFLIQIEASGTGIMPGLLVAGALQDSANTIITHWSLITGRDMRAGKVVTT